MKNANIDFDSMKVLKHFNPMFQLCFRAIPSIVQGGQQQSSHRDNLKSGNKHQQQRQLHRQFSYILITKPQSNLPQKIFQCRSICPIFNHKSQSYILVKGQNLWDYYKSKKLKQLIFTQDEIWVFMRQIVQGLMKLAQYGIYHSHLKQYAIYRMGQYSYQLLYHGEMKSMVQLAQSSQYYWYDFYMAPEELAVNMGGRNGRNNGMNSNDRSHYQNSHHIHQQDHNHHQQHNPQQRQKHTIFSLGLMVLNMMNLQQFNKSFYNKQKLDIDWSVIKQKINNSKHKYSTTIISLIEKCLLPSIEQRVTLKQLYSSIVNHQNQFKIMNDKYKLRVDQLLINNNKRQGFGRHSSQQLMMMSQNKNKNSLYSSPSQSKQKKHRNSTNSSGKKTQSSQKNSHVNVNGNKMKITQSIQKDHYDINDKQESNLEVKKWSTSLLTNRQQQRQQKQKQIKQRQKYSIATTRQRSKQTINKKANKLSSPSSSLSMQNINSQSHHHHYNNRQQQQQQQQQQQIINFDRGTFGGYGDDLHYNNSLLPLPKHAQSKGAATTTTTKISTKHITVQNHNNQQNQFKLNSNNSNNKTNHTTTNHIKIETQNVDNNNNNSNENNQDQLQQIFEREKLVTFGGQHHHQLDLQKQKIHNSQQTHLAIHPIQPTPQSIINTISQHQQSQQQYNQYPLKQKQKHEQKITKLITIQDLKLKQLDFIQSQKQIQNFKSLIKNNQKPITLKLQSCLIPIQTLQISITNQPGIYIQGNLYYGPFKNGRRNGFGLQIFPQNQYYYGQFKDDLFHGQGFYYWNENQYFLGIFQNGTKTFGTLVSPKIYYTGQFKNSKKMNGIGIQKIKTGEIYTGQWKQGKKHGIGQLIEITNDKFIGQWENNKKSGYGEYIISNYPQQGFKIKAIWYKNQIISDTIVQYSNGNEYQGPLNNDFQKHGKGLYRFKKGGYFKGTFYNDNPTHGQLVYKNGQKYIGSLRNMKRHGFGEYHYSDGTIKKGNWIDDVRVEKDTGYNY